MRVVSNKALVKFAEVHRDAATPLQAWRKLAEAGSYASYAALKAAFNGIDKVGEFFVFNIGGNKFRVIASIHFNRRMLFVRHVFTHKEYDKWKP